MYVSLLALCSLAIVLGGVLAQCPDYAVYSTETHEPFSEGRYRLSFQRPSIECRKFNVPEAEAAIEEMRGLVKDPDLFRLFENAFPNTLDTTVTWKGFASNDSDEEVNKPPWAAFCHKTKRD
jgi:uncharacterized protein